MVMDRLMIVAKGQFRLYNNLSDQLKMDNPDDVPVGGFIYDTIPQDTFYVGDSATQSGLAYSPNGSSN